MTSSCHPLSRASSRLRSLDFRQQQQEGGYDTDTSSGRRVSTRVRIAKQVYSPENFHSVPDHSEREAPRALSPSKRRSQKSNGNSAPTAGLKSGIDGLALLLMACELLDRNDQGVVTDVAANSMLESASRNVSAPIPVQGYNASPFADAEDYTHGYAAGAAGSIGSRSPPKKTSKKPASPRKSKDGSSPRKPRGSKPVGPCTNPHCMNPFESPQWRRGPPEAPVLCNACGTRWIRNKSLVPIVPQRGIRYGKDGAPNRPGSPSKSGSRSASASPRKSLREASTEAELRAETAVVETGEVANADASVTLVGTETTSVTTSLTNPTDTTGLENSLSFNLSSSKSSKSVNGARVISLVASINGMLSAGQDGA